MCLLYNNRYLFTGDHLAWNVEKQHLTAFSGYCWYSWEEQIKSMERLAGYSFEWVLPGHGRRVHLVTPKMNQQLHRCIEWMKQA